MSTPSDSLHSSPSGVVKTLRPVEQTTPASGLVDLMGGDSRRHIRIGEHGFVALVDVMPRLVEPADNGTASADAAIVQAARVSYGAGTKKVHEDRGLIRYLLRHRHTTPFEMVEFKFHVSMPIFVARQWIRHRTANVNEYSGRYSEMPDHFYRPDAGGVRLQSTTNKQGGEETIPAGSQTEGSFFEYLDRAEALYEEYQQLMEKGVSRELARIAAPAERVHAVVLEVRLAQHAPIPVAAHGLARAEGDPRLRRGDVPVDRAVVPIHNRSVA